MVSNDKEELAVELVLTWVTRQDFLVRTSQPWPRMRPWDLYDHWVKHCYT